MPQHANGRLLFQALLTFHRLVILLANCQSGIGKKYEILNKNQCTNETRRKPMSMHPHPIPAIPEETTRVARAILPQGNVYLQMRDELGTLYQDEDFRDLFKSRGQPAEVPWRLALVTLMQYAEGLTDRQAADAVRTRIDWKYVLSLELTDSGFDFSVLSEFRGRLLAHGAERRLFDTMLSQFRERGWRKRARQATHRFDARAGRYSHAAPAGMCGGDDASRAQRPGRSCSHLAPGTHGPRVG